MVSAEYLRTLKVLLTVTILAGPAAVAGQALPVSPGDHIRLTVTAAHGSRIVGFYNPFPAADSVCVSNAEIGRAGWVIEGGVRQWYRPRTELRACVPRDALLGVEVKESYPPARLWKFTRGTLTGALVGAVLGVVVWAFDDPSQGTRFSPGTGVKESLPTHVRVSAILGGAVGAVFGTASALSGESTRWARPPLDSAWPQIAVGVRNGQPSLGLAIAF